MKFYTCPLCGRNKFTREFHPHYCNGIWIKHIKRYYNRRGLKITKWEESEG